VLVDNRDVDLDSIVKKHTKFLPKEWKTIIYRPYWIKSTNDYNKFITTIWFWEDLREYERVLIIQHDSELLRFGIDEFLEYDYVGAPWTFQLKGGNGGLSLRNPKVMLKCLSKFPYSLEYGNEDVYFSNTIEKVGGNLAPRDVCFNFSCETIYRLGTLGYHAIDKYMSKEQINNILNQYK
jgi:hypothetical protein